MSEVYTRDGWRIQITGQNYEYQRQVTLSGAAENIDLQIYFPVSINRISYSSDDATAKSFATRIFNGGIDLTTYDEVGAWAINTDISLTYTPLGEEGVYSMHPIMVRTALTASTAGKLLTIKIVVRKLD